MRRGVSEGVAVLLTGHKTAAVFRRYDIINERDLIEGVEKLAAGPVVTDWLQTGTVRRLRATSDARQQLSLFFAGVVELADTRDLKSLGG